MIKNPSTQKMKIFSISCFGHWICIVYGNLFIIGSGKEMDKGDYTEWEDEYV